NLQKKQNQENSRSSFPFSFSPCSLIKSTKTVSEMLARRDSLGKALQRGFSQTVESVLVNRFFARRICWSSLVWPLVSQLAQLDPDRLFADQL
ncbi:MAG: hypothetical protein ABSA96_09305, partial [Candidatus Acidiferrales bacterium]